MLVGSVKFAIERYDMASYISHAVGVVSGHMANPGKAVKWVLRYFRSTRITYKKGDRTRHQRN